MFRVHHLNNKLSLIEAEDITEMNKNKVSNLDAPPSVKLKTISSVSKGIPRSRSRDSINKVSYKFTTQIILLKTWHFHNSYTLFYVRAIF